MLVEFYHAGKLKIVSLVLLGIVGGLVLISGFLGLWILLKNIYRLLQSITVKSRQRFKSVEVEDFSRQTIIDELAKSSLFEECQPQTLVKIADAVDVMETPGRNFIINEGDEDDDTFYHLLAGKVEVIKELPSGRYDRIAVLERGDSFGEIALLKNVPRTPFRAGVEKVDFAFPHQGKFRAIGPAFAGSGEDSGNSPKKSLSFPHTAVPQLAPAGPPKVRLPLLFEHL